MLVRPVYLGVNQVVDPQLDEHEVRIVRNVFSCDLLEHSTLGSESHPPSLTEAPPEVRRAHSALRAIDEPVLGMREGLVQPLEDEDVHVFGRVERVRPKWRGGYVGEGIEGMGNGSRKAVFRCASDGGALGARGESSPRMEIGGDGGGRNEAATFGY